MTTLKKKVTRSVRPRATLALKGTTRTAGFHLDHSSDLAVAFAQAWLRREGSPKVPASGIVRRALALYLAHLEGPAAAEEVRAVERACKATSPDGICQGEAWKRLEALDAVQPLPPFSEVLHGPRRGYAWGSEQDRQYEALLEHIGAA
jgi:hypothetical protein